MAWPYESESEGEEIEDGENPFEDLVDDFPPPGDDDTESSDDSVAPATARERKKAALYPPIASICSAMGGFEEFRTEDGGIETAYSLGDQVVGCLKDLKRFWRMDEKDDDRTVARIFYEVGVLKGDLIPILLTTLGTGAKGDRIALACVELMGAMTWPINVIEELRDAKAQDELKASMDYAGLIAAQLSYKAAILRGGALRAMFQVMTPSLSKSRRERTSKDESVISLVLHTFRNLAALKDPVSTSESADAIEMSNLQSDYIQQLSDENIFDLLIAIANNAESSEYAPWNLITLDIFHLIFRSVKPHELMVPANKVDETRLKDLLEVEDLRRKAAAKRTNSRHSRFGTTISLQSGGKRYIIHKQSSLAVGAEKTMDLIKKKATKKVRVDDDLQPPSNLRPDAVRCLRNVAISFLDSAFNPFFASVLKDIRMERMKVKESDTVRFLYLARFFLEFFLLVYKDEQNRGVDPQSDEGHDFDLIAEMTETHSIGFVTQRMKAALEEKPPQWIELHASIDCFVQMLLVIDTLLTSGVEDNVDVAEILQNKLYYESDMLDMVLEVITRYNTQSHKYLDSIINLAYVLLRMLETYSKSKAYMYVRKKKKNRAGKKKKSKQGAEAEEGDGVGMGDDDDEQEEADRGSLTYSEHVFTFETFEQKFAQEPILQTCMTYLESYRSFTDPEQMKRIVSLMHRQAIKAKTEGLFFKPTVLELFRRILEDESLNMSRDPHTVDLKKLIEYILKKFFKSVKENSLMLLEIFYPKTRNQLGKMRAGIDDPYATTDDEGPTTKDAAAIREVEVQPGFSLTLQIGIAVAVLIDDDKLPLVQLILSQLALASAARTEVVLSTDGDSSVLPDEDEGTDEALRRKASRLQGPSKEAIALFSPHVVEWDSDSHRKAGWNNVHFKLLMRLLKWESSEVPEAHDLVWTIPSSLLPSTLDGDIRIINGFLADPVDPNGKTAADLLRKKRKVPVRKRKAREAEDEDEGNESTAPKQRQKKRKEEAIAYKSAQFIEDSDEEDNEERDRIFFAAEAALREKINAGAISAVAATGSKKQNNKAKNANKEKTAGATDAPDKPVRKRRKGELPKALVVNISFDTLDSSDEDRAGGAEKAPASGGSSTSPAYMGSSTSASSPKRVTSPSSSSSPQIAAAGSEQSNFVPIAAMMKKKRRVITDSDDD